MNDLPAICESCKRENTANTHCVHAIREIEKAKFEAKFYNSKMFCSNCGHMGTERVQKGHRVSPFNKCPNCECDDYQPMRNIARGE